MAGRIIAVAGLCGAGKSKAVDFLAEATGGEIIYFGGTLLRVMRERGLEATSENEQIMRIDLRKENGDACLAIVEAERIKAIVAKGRSVLIDAVYVGEEFNVLSKLVPSVQFSLIGIEAPFTTRMERLEKRPLRPLNESQLRARDAVEIKNLNTGAVLMKAVIRITNDGTVAEFEAALKRAL